MDTATPTQSTDAKHQQELAGRKKHTRLVRFLLPQVDANSALLPTDKWALNAVWGFAKTNKSFHKTAGGMAGFALGGVAAVAAGVAGMLLVTGLAPVAAVAVAAIGIAGFFAKKAHGFFNGFKKETLPQLRADIGKKYLDLKMGEVKSAWLKKKEEHEKKKAAEKAQAAAAPKAEAKKPEEKTAAPVTATAAPKAGEKPGAAGAVGGWLLKKALEQANRKKDAAAPVTPAQDNAAPKAPDKKAAPPKAAA